MKKMRVREVARNGERQREKHEGQRAGSRGSSVGEWWAHVEWKEGGGCFVECVVDLVIG